MKEALKTYRWQPVLQSLLIFFGAGVIIFALGSGNSAGVLSVGWIIYFFQWWLLAAVGLLLLILYWLKRVPIRHNLFYSFLSVANLCNGIGGLSFILIQGNTGSLLSTVLLLGATACIGFLLLIEVLTSFPNSGGQ